MLSLSPSSTTAGTMHGTTANAYTHPFFSLPTELHTQIFTCACTPSSDSSSACTGPSYYEAFYTGLALSRVSRYINAASAPARPRSVVLEGWREMVGFLRMLEAVEGEGERRRGRVRYLTIMADEMPFDPVEMLAERSLYPPYATPSTLALPLHVNATIEGRQRRKERERTRERMMLETLGRILRIVRKELYELELGMQAVAHVKDPLVHLCDASSSHPHPHPSYPFHPSTARPTTQLCFPNLTTMFYACSPAGVYPWASSYSLQDRFPCLFCPRLRDLTVVVCNDGNASFDDEGEVAAGTGVVGVNDNGETAPEGDRDRNTTGSSDADTDAEERHPTPKPSPFPHLQLLTILASTPTQALAALDVEDWEVGSEIPVPFSGSSSSSSSSASASINNNDDDDGASSDSDSDSKELSRSWPPQTLETIVLCPKSRWGERWESLRAVVEGGDRRGEVKATSEVRVQERDQVQDRDVDEGMERKGVEVRVLMPGEVL